MPIFTSGSQERIRPSMNSGIDAPEPMLAIGTIVERMRSGA